MKGPDFLKKGKWRILLPLAAALLAVLALPPFFNLNRYRPLIERQCAEYLPVVVHLEGELSCGLLPSPHLEIEKIRVDNPPAFGTAPLLTVERLSARVAFWPLLHRRLQVSSLQLERPHLDIIKNGRGQLNFALPPTAAGADKAPPSLTGLRIGKIDIRDLRLSYRGEADKGDPILLQGGSMQLRDIVLQPGANSTVQLLEECLSLRGTFTCQNISAENREYSDVRILFAHRDGKEDIDLSRAGVEGCLLQGKTSIDLRSRPVRIAAAASLLPGRGGEGGAFQLENGGEFALQADLDFEPEKLSEPLAAMHGKVRLKGHGLLVNGYNLDTVIEQYRKTSNVSLIDIGAFVVAGPLAVLVTKGVQTAGIRRGIGDVQTTIVRLGAEIDLKDGVATADDVAFTTARNRIAVKGKIDLIQQRYRQVEVAVVDSGGCAEIRQTIDGPLTDPDLDTAKLGLRTLGNPLATLWRKAANLMGTTACQPFYKGVIPQPGE